ncbi:MAG: peptidoglycan DD-metalloendopeptidase family protein [Ardenticatenaceae bacterium]
MRRMILFLTLALLLIQPANTDAASFVERTTAPDMNQLGELDCLPLDQRMASLGLPSSDSLLLAQANTNVPAPPPPDTVLQPSVDPNQSVAPTPDPVLPPTAEPSQSVAPTPEPVLPPTAEPSESVAPTPDPVLPPTAEPGDSVAPTDEQSNAPTQTTYLVARDDTLSKIAVRFDRKVYELMDANGLQNSSQIHVGQELVIPLANQYEDTPPPNIEGEAVKPLLPPFETVWIEGKAVQGEAVMIWLKVAAETTVRGQLGDQSIPFREHCGLLWGLVAFDALHDPPGIHNLALYATAERQDTKTTVPITLEGGDFWSGPPVRFGSSKSHLLDKSVIDAENQALNDLFASLPDDPPRWQGAFQLPRNSTVTGGFGSRGIVDGEPIGYHEGIDYRGYIGSPFYAPASGVIVVAQPLTVRGNTVYIDHGAGVTSGYFHMSQMDVEVGDLVATGDLLGKIGDTGLTTGPHLHWEIRVNGRWVNPRTWLQRSFPVSPMELGAQDWAIPYGRFYTESAQGLGGFTVVDDRNARFFSHFLRLGGLQTVGYPISVRYQRDGFLTQAFQKMILQWRPEVGEAWPKNVFDDLSSMGYDTELLYRRQIPPRLGSDFDPPSATWPEIIATRYALLESNPAIRDHYFSVDDPLTIFGLPTSHVQDMGNHYAIRTQRAVFQQWKEDVPWAAKEQVTIANGGDMMKEFGIIESTWLTPEGISKPR